MEEYNQKCRSHPEEQALYICIHSTCQNVMFCDKCINNHQEHQKQLMNKSTAIMTIEHVSFDLKQFLNLFQNKQKIKPDEDHQEQKRNDIISNTIKHLKQLHRPPVEEQQQQKCQKNLKLLIVGLLSLVVLLQIKICLSSANTIDQCPLIQQDSIQEQFQQYVSQNLTLQQCQCEQGNIQRKFQIDFDKFKHRHIDILDSKSVHIIQQFNYGQKFYFVALSNDSFDIHNDKIKATFEINGRGFMIGICSHPLQSKFGYQFNKNIGQGCYLISDDGYMYHDVGHDFNGKVKIWTKFTDQTIVYMEYQQYYLEFKTNHGDQVQRIYIDKELQYYNIAIVLSERGTKATII